MFRDLKYGHSQWAYFLSEDENAALEYLKKNGKEGEIVMASPKTSQFIFAFTPCRTVTGHFMLTQDYAPKTADVFRFYTCGDLSIMEEILKKYKVKYILDGPYEQETFHKKVELPNRYTLIFNKGNTKLFTVPEFR